MAKHKTEDQTPPTDSPLEARVDAMMDPRRPEEPADVPKAAPVKTSDSDLPPLDIFADAKTAPDVPGALQERVEEIEDDSQAAKEAEVPAATEETIEPVPIAPIELDDATTDAAVDEIVAHEADTVLAAEDAAIEKESALTEEPPKKIHHHPLFWTFITIIAVLAIVLAMLLASGGNLTFPGSGRLQSWRESLQN